MLDLGLEVEQNFQGPEFLRVVSKVHYSREGKKILVRGTELVSQKEKNGEG